MRGHTGTWGRKGVTVIWVLSGPKPQVAVLQAFLLFPRHPTGPGTLVSLRLVWHRTEKADGPVKRKAENSVGKIEGPERKPLLGTCGEASGGLPDLGVRGVCGLTPLAGGVGLFTGVAFPGREKSAF